MMLIPVSPLSIFPCPCVATVLSPPHPVLLVPNYSSHLVRICFFPLTCPSKVAVHPFPSLLKAFSILAVLWLAVSAGFDRSVCQGTVKSMHGCKSVMEKKCVFIGWRNHLISDSKYIIPLLNEEVSVVCLSTTDKGSLQEDAVESCGGEVQSLSPL